ncbi:MAG: PGF-CTERM sorting domain-containing protein [Halobacteriota archaeon]
MPRSAHWMTLLLLSVIAVLLLVSAAVIPTSATTIIQLQPNTVNSGDRVLVSADMAKNASTVGLSYYADSNNNGKDDDGGAWVKIANATDGGANDADNTTNGFILFSWMTPQFPPGQYIVKVEDPNGPTRTTVLTVNNAQLTLAPVIYGPKLVPDKGLVNPGNSFSVVATVTGNCRLCHTTDTPTTQNPGVNGQKVKSAFSADLSQITGLSSDAALAPDYVHHQHVDWTGIASKTLADNQTLSVTVNGTNPAGNLTTQSTAYAGVNKAVNIPYKSTYQNTTGSSASASAAQSSGSKSNPLPGFEALFAVAGLNLVAYLVSKRR